MFQMHSGADCEADGRKCDVVEAEGNGICGKDRRQDQQYQCKW
jgi:hypothetical protein